MLKDFSMESRHEHRHFILCSLCRIAKSTATMNMIVPDLFTNCRKACEVLGISDSFYEDICHAIPRNKPLKIGEDGTILEWNEPLSEQEVHHRHTSHLYALRPADLIKPEKDRELADACRKTLEIWGDDGVGRSLARKVSFRARLRDGNRALKLLERQLRYVPARENEGESFCAWRRHLSQSARHMPAVPD